MRDQPKKQEEKLRGFHRKIIFTSQTGPNGHRLARACLEDDFHHFRVELVSDGISVLAVSGTALRFPYLTCPEAAPGLDALVGQSVADYSASVHRRTDARLNCTHLLDLAGLCCALIKLGVDSRRYKIFVSDRENDKIDGRYIASLSQDGDMILSFRAKNETIEFPQDFHGVNLRAGFAKWAFETLDVDMREAALALRRCAMISMGRAKNLKEEIHAADWGFCYSQQKHRAKTALRVNDSIKDFNENPSLLCQTDRDWINGGPLSNTDRTSQQAAL